MFVGSLSDGLVTIPICDPQIERANVAEQSTPLVSTLSKHVDLMLGRCNTFAMPMHEPSHGWVLVSRGDLVGFDLNARVTLTFVADSPTSTTVIWRNLVICREPQALTPGIADDPDGVCLVELSDARWLVRNPHFQVSINEIYNVRATAYQGASGASAYLAASLNSGAAWTWSEMVGDIWATMSAQLGAYPGLPFTPDGDPEGWAFSGTPAWDALTAVLRRIGCAVSADLSQTTGPYTIVRVGAADATTEAAITAAELANRKIHDAEFQTAVRGIVPYGVEVFFGRRELYGSNEKATRRDSSAWYGDAVHSVQVIGPESTDAEFGVYHPISDDLPAIYDHSGTLTNSAALTTRAQERADDFYRMLRSSGGKRRWQAFSGLLVVSPGSTLKGVAWRCRGGDGVYTELVNHPFLMMGLDAAGGWREIEVDNHRAANAPTAGPSVLRAQVVKIANGTPSGAYYDATVEVRDNAGTAWASQESVYVIDLAGASSLTTNARYDAVHVGYENTRPLYAIRSATGGGSTDAFKTIAVSGQSDVVADSPTDTLTLEEGNGVTITTDAATDTITFSVSYVIGLGYAGTGPNISTTPVAWDSGVEYQVGSVVEESGDVYRCKLLNTNQIPPNGTYWDLVSSSVIIINIPEASLTNDGIITNEQQTITGYKIIQGEDFDSLLTVKSIDSGNGDVTQTHYQAHFITAVLPSPRSSFDDPCYGGIFFGDANTIITHNDSISWSDGGSVSIGLYPAAGVFGAGTNSLLILSGIKYDKTGLANPLAGGDQPQFVVVDSTVYPGVAKYGQWSTQGGLVFSGGIYTGGTLSVGTSSLAGGAVTNAKLADMPAHTIKMNPTGSSAPPDDIAESDLPPDTPVSGDWILGWLSSGEIAKFTFDDFGGGGGEWTESNQNNDFTVGTTNYVLYTIGTVVGGYSGNGDLPPASGNAGLMVGVKITSDHVASNLPFTLNADGSDEIDGDPTLVLNGIGDCVALFCTGSEWLIVWDNRDRNWTAVDRSISGLNLLYSSSTVVKVEPGTCSANSGEATIALASRTSITVTSNGAISGNDSFAGSGTASTNTANATVTGSSSAFLTEFGTRAMTGTVSSSGDTVTGTGTLFMTEIWVGCLLGNATKGYFQVKAIASDTSLTLVSTPGSAFSSSSVNAIENPTIKVSTNTAIQVTAIASDTSLTIAANSSATVSGQTYRIGVLPTTTTYPASNNFHLNIWIGNGGNGTGVFASTQRTTPFGVAGYNTYLRRLGSVLLNAGSVQGFSQWGNSNNRWIQYEIARNTIGLRVLSIGMATSWAAVYCGGVVPPLAKAINFNANVASITGYSVYYRARNTGDSATSRSLGVTCTSIGGTSDCFLAACDAAGYVDYVNGHASLTAYLDVIGYQETL